MSHWDDWFEITTYANDPSRIEIRRLPPDEARDAYREKIREALSVCGFGTPYGKSPLTDLIAQYESLFEPEPETVEVDHLERCKSNLAEKRHELRVKTTPAYARVIQPVFRIKRCRPKGNR
jgi:hypothetical protein